MIYERVIGPVHGRYIAVYACPVGEFGREYLAHVRMFTFRPRSFWDRGCVFNERLLPRFSTAETALHCGAVRAWRTVRSEDVTLH